jgi:amino acid adenylation domain-containing protein
MVPESQIRQHGESYLIHAAFMKQARLGPEAIAVVGSNAALSYAELDRHSKSLARYLRRHGAGPEVPVGVCARRSAEVVVALLGILRAGGVYVPLDPEYPPERLRFMMDDAKVNTVLVQRGTRVSLPSRINAIEIGPVLFEEDGDDISVSVLPENLAYIIYTSGSTGTPKGVMVSLAAISNTLDWLQDTFHLTTADVVAHKTSISFTDSIWELLWPLLAGSRLVVIEEKVSQFPRLLLQQLRQHDVTVTQFVPAQMRLFLDEVERAAKPDPLPHLRWVFNGGEALPPALARDWYRSFPNTRIANAYGMTESAIYGTNWIVEPGDGEPTVLVGRPISNERAYVLDTTDQPCPPLCSGEIHLAGASLARGYFGQPDLTAERFVPDPFGPAGSRMYRTGDLGRQLEGGDIDCLGRLDRQVKVHGARVELGEVEAALGKHPNVRQAVVMARREGTDNQIVAYYTYRKNDPGPRGLYRFLADKLPGFMIPAFLVPMESFPLSHNGKVDRRRLASPQ